MKNKFLKALGVTALAAALVPCRVEKDEETGVKTYQSLLSRLRVGPGEEGKGTDIRMDLLGGVIPSALADYEKRDYADDELGAGFDIIRPAEEAEQETILDISLNVSRDVPTEPAAPAAPVPPVPPAQPVAPEAPQPPEKPDESAIEL